MVNYVLYSDLKTEHYTPIVCDKLYSMGIRSIICDFDPSSELTGILKHAGIRSYLRQKLYYMPSSAEVESGIKDVLKFGFNGYALDLEAYSESTIWEYRGYEYGLEIRKMIENNLPDNVEIVIYPELLGSEKYYKYLDFLRAFDGMNLTFLMERTYNVWKPFDLVYFYFRAKRDIGKAVKHFEIRIGIWPESLPWICGRIQVLFTRLFKKVFFYSEPIEDKGITGRDVDAWRKLLK